MSVYTEFFLNSKASIIQLELLEISHSNFTQTWRIVRNATAGVTVTHESGGGGSFAYIYRPLEVVGNGTRDDLDFSMSVNLGDLGEIIPAEIDEISSANGFGEKPVVKYRTYKSDDLTVPLFGPLVLQIGAFSFKREGASFEAKAPSLNISKTGELYTIDRMPMLRGFL